MKRFFKWVIIILAGRHSLQNMGRQEADGSTVVRSDVDPPRRGGPLCEKCLLVKQIQNELFFEIVYLFLSTWMTTQM